MGARMIHMCEVLENITMIWEGGDMTTVDPCIAMYCEKGTHGMYPMVTVFFRCYRGCPFTLTLMWAIN